MKKLATLIALLFTLLLPNKIVASHIIGSDFTYECTPTPNIYKVTLKVYTNCAAIPLCGCPINTACNFGIGITGVYNPYIGSNFGTQTLTIVPQQSLVDAIQLCSTVTSGCSSCSTKTPGTFYPAIEILTFQGMVNLQSIPSACCDVRLVFSTGTRDLGANSIINSGEYYSDAIINRCVTPCNSSPKINSDALLAVCSNTAVNYNLGAIDLDGDSLSYSLSNTLISTYQSAIYQSPYNGLNPFPTINNQGVTLDPVNGNLNFRPNGVFSSHLAIDITQWKDSLGTPKKAGVTRRDVRINSMFCSTNQTPFIKIFKNNILQPTTNIDLEEGKSNCLILVAAKEPLNSDTTYLTWKNENYLTNNGATFTRLYDSLTRNINGPIKDSIKFCWTPPIGSSRKMPYFFTVYGQDNFCPLPGKFIYNIGLRVKNVFISEQPQSQTTCADKNISLKVSGNFVGTRYYQWYKNGVLLSNQTDSILNLNNIKYSDGGKYNAWIWNDQTVYISDTALITVVKKPEATINKTYNYCGNFKFTYTLNTFPFANDSNTQWKIETTAKSNLYTEINAPQVLNHQFTSAGWHKIMLKLVANGIPLTDNCFNIIIDSVYIPELLKVTVNDTNVCDGSSIIIRAKGKGGIPFGPNYKYALFKDGNLVKNYSYDSIFNLPSATPNSYSNYQLVINDLNNCTDTGNFKLYTTPSIITNPIVGSTNIVGDTSFKTYKTTTNNLIANWVADGGIVLNQFTDSITVKWINSGNNKITLTLTDSFGCTKAIVLNVFVNNIEITSQPASSLACLKANHIFTVKHNATNASYEWFKDGTAIANSNKDTLYLNNLTTLDEGNYTVKITTPLGTINSNNAKLTVIVIDKRIILDNNTLYSYQFNAKYQWLNCDSSFLPMLNDTIRYFSPALNKSYAVKINYNGCVDTSNCFPFVKVGYGSLNQTSAINIFPNPTKGDFTIDFGVNFTGKIEILNAEGKKIQYQNIVNKQKETFIFNGSAGTYFVQLSSKDIKQTLKLILQK